MPTDDERREVAAELRELAKDYEKVPAWDVIAAGELPAPIDDAFMACGLGRAVYATEIFGRLADLIEPEKRTCRNIANKNDREFGAPFICSECGADPHDAESYFCGFSNGEHDWRFCPNCGAKVVEE